MRPLVFLVIASACAGSSSPAADAAAGAPAWGTAVFMAVNRSTVELDGREVELVGLQAEVADYER